MNNKCGIFIIRQTTQVERLWYLALVIAVILTNCITTQAAGLANARAVAMGGAYTSLARGYDAPYFNPANLGLDALRQNGLQMVGIGAAISNNSFSLDDYNNYTGATLDDDDKQTLLNKIPSEGLKVSADAEASIMSLCIGNMAVSVSGIGVAEINLSRTIIEVILNGNAYADTLNFDGMYGNGYGIAAVNFSYGKRLYKNVDRQLAVGATVKYLKGFGIEEVTEMNGEMVTLPTGFKGAGNMVARTSTGGSGYALDLGTALQINKKYSVGVTIFNVVSNVRWTEETKEHRYIFSFDTLTVLGMGDDSIVTSSDTTIDAGAFSTHLPSSIKAGLAKTSGRFLWAVDWEQGLKNNAGCTTTPRLSTGAEYRLIGLLPLRAGFAMGGKHGTTYSAGLGIDLALAYIDLAAANYNAISGSSGKGLNFAINTGIRF